jgi:hypothetical protein
LDLAKCNLSDFVLYIIWSMAFRSPDEAAVSRYHCSRFALPKGILHIIPIGIRSIGARPECRALCGFSFALQIIPF